MPGEIAALEACVLFETFTVVCYSATQFSAFLTLPTGYKPFFTFSVGDKALDGYSKKKYVCKLLFIFLLGHDIDFGHMEAVNLLSSNRYTEKQIVSMVEGQGLVPCVQFVESLPSTLFHIGY